MYSTVLAKAQDDGLPVVLEAMMNSITFYQRLGFTIRQELNMMLPQRGSSEPTERYEERVMGWK